MKVFGIDQIKNFPFVTPPNQEKIMAAERLLVMLGALSKELFEYVQLIRICESINF